MALPIIAGIAGLIATIALAFILTSQPRQGSDLAVMIPEEPMNQTIVGIAPNTTGLISQADAIVIAMNETGLINETEKIEQTHADWFYVDGNGLVYRVNPQTMEMASTEGDMSREIEKIADFDRIAHYWVISFEMGIDTGYVLIVDASDGEIKDKSGYEF